MVVRLRAPTPCPPAPARSRPPGRKASRSSSAPRPRRRPQAARARPPSSSPRERRPGAVAPHGRRRTPAAQPLHRPHLATRAVRRRRRPRRRPLGHPRGGERQARRPGRRRLAARRRPGHSRGAAGRLRRAALSGAAATQSEALGATAQRLAERDPVWLTHGGRRRAAGSRRMPKTSKAKRLAGLDVEVEKGYSPGGRPGRGQALPAVHLPQPRRLRSAAPGRGVRHHHATSWSRRAAASALVEPQTSIRSSGATWSAASPAAAASGSAATWPARPATTSPAAASPSTWTRPTARPCSWPTASAAAAASAPAPPARSLFNERELSSFKVDESRCIMCRECVNVCPVDALEETNTLRGRPQGMAEPGRQGQRPGRRSPHVRRLRRSHRRAPGAHGHQRPGGGQFGHRLPRGEHHHLPVHLVEEQLHPHRLRELGRHAVRRGDRVPRAQEEGRASTRTSSSSPSAATAAPTTSGSSPCRAPWSAATRCSTSATTTAPT